MHAAPTKVPKRVLPRGGRLLGLGIGVKRRGLKIAEKNPVKKEKEKKKKNGGGQRVLKRAGKLIF